uniref:Putative monooxygenase n=1 Tax=Fusarium heterosporum TaxID=42747 RepID=S0ASL7_FUSHE|nr:putative monooxygenase [Fusarium heterosporum]
MISNNKPFKVLIVGGGVAGLTLANMLERFNIDYLILEGHGDIAPAVGASIGMFPNGLRILDQIDLYEPLEKLMGSFEETQSTRDMKGRPILSIPKFQDHVRLRHGYPLMFFDRQYLLKVLHERLKYKQRVLLNQKVVDVHLVGDGVEVTTADNQRFEGSILVGADGVHSIVRRHMFRLGHQLDPETFPTDSSTKQECHYLCSYGIARNVPGWVQGDQCTVLGNGHSQLVVSGPENKTYWFFFSKLPTARYGSEIPTCTEAMEADFAKNYAHVTITEKVTFGQVFAHRISSTLTPIHEYVLDKWFFDRIICLGDSVHKPNPIGGQGGNGAIESAAELINALMTKKASLGSLEAMNTLDIQNVFSDMQSKRHERAKRIVFASHLQQSLVAYEKPGLSKFVWRLFVPLKGDEASLGLFGLTLAGASRLERLELKARPRAIPYRDELPAPPLTRVLIVRLAFVVLMLYLFHMARQIPITSQDNTTHMGLQLVTPVVIYMLEGYRLGNGGTPLALPSLFLLAIYFQGLHRVAPIYAIFHALMGLDLPTGRYVQPEVIFSLLAALVVLLVTGAYYISDYKTWGAISPAAAQTTTVITFFLSYGLQNWIQRSLSRTAQGELAFGRYKGKDLSLLKFTYASIGSIQAAFHIRLVVLPMLATTTPSGLWWGLRRKLVPLSVPEMSEYLPEMVFFLSNLYSIWNLRRLGFITTNQLFFASLVYAGGQFAVGTRAAWMGVWYWREIVFAELMVCEMIP